MACCCGGVVVEGSGTGGLILLVQLVPPGWPHDDDNKQQRCSFAMDIMTATTSADLDRSLVPRLPHIWLGSFKNSNRAENLQIFDGVDESKKCEMSETVS